MSVHSNVPKLRFPGFTHPWEQRKLSDLTDSIDTGKSKFEVRDNGKYEILGSTSVIGYDESYDYEGDFILTARVGANAGNLYRHSGKVKISDNTVFLQGKHLDFIYYLLDSYDIKKLSFGTGQPLVKASELKSLDLMVPQSETEKQKIGEFLTKLDDTITLHQRQCDELELFKKGMLQKMFPSDGAVVPEIRFPGFTHPWEQCKLSELIDEYKETVDSDCTLPILTSSKTEGVVLQEEHFGRKQLHDIAGYNILPRGYCTYRNRSDGVDFTFNINKCCDKGIISKFYPVFCGNNSNITFISMVLNYSDEVIHEIGYTCVGTGQKVLSFTDLQKMKIRVPSLVEQDMISEFFSTLDDLITLHQRKLDELKELKRGLLQQMFI